MNRLFSASAGFRSDILRKISCVTGIESRFSKFDDFLPSVFRGLVSVAGRCPFVCCSFGIVTVSTLRTLARPRVSTSVSWLQLLQQFNLFVPNRLRPFIVFTSDMTGCNMLLGGRPFFVSNGSIDFDVINRFFDETNRSADDEGDSSDIDLMVVGMELLLGKT